MACERFIFVRAYGLMDRGCNFDLCVKPFIIKTQNDHERRKTDNTEKKSSQRSSVISIARIDPPLSSRKVSHSLHKSVVLSYNQQNNTSKLIR